jgi:hypothetical protein
VVLVVEGVLIIQPSESGQNLTDPHLSIRAAPNAKAPAPTVLPAPSPATTLAPATAAEQAAFNAGQHSCQTSPFGSLDPAGAFDPAGADEEAAFKAGRQWCHSSTPIGRHGTKSKG